MKVQEIMRLVDVMAGQVIHVALAAHTGKTTEASPGVDRAAVESAIADALAAEREACATLCEEMWDAGTHEDKACQLAADEIRKRSNV